MMIINKMTKLELQAAVKGLLDVIQTLKTDENSVMIDTICEKYKDDKDSALDEQFDQFWYAYPRQRRGNKQKAKEVFIKIIKSGKCTPDKLIRQSAAYSLCDEVKRGFAKGCEAWLNDERYEWEYRPTNQNSVLVAMSNIVGEL